MPDEAAQRLRQLERRFAEVERMAAVGSWEWDVPSNTVTWSPELYRIYGRTPENFEATYEGFLAVVHPDERDAIHETVQRAYETGESYRLEHRIVRPDGRIRWLHSRGDVTRDDAGNSVRIAGVVIDITDRRRVEVYLREFISNAAHEIRTPMAAMNQAVHLLTSQDLDSEAARDVLEVLARQTARLSELSSDLLDLTALEAGPSQVMLQNVALDEVITAAVDAVAAQQDLQVEVDVPPLKVTAAEDDAIKVFTNLLTNVVRHGGGRGEIGCTTTDNEVTVTVRDHGDGVDPQRLDDLFSPFARIGRDGLGSGLGLAIASRLMKRFGGSLEYRDAPGGGACFDLRFERADDDDPAG